MARLSFYTLFIALAVVSTTFNAVPSVNALQGMNLTPPPVVRRAEHVDLSRRMTKKKRQDTPINPAAGNSPSPSAETPSQSASASTPVDTPSRSQTSATSTPTNTSTSTSTSASTSSTSSTSSISSTSTASVQTENTSTSAPSTTPRSSTRSVVLVTQTASSTPSAAAAQDTEHSFLPKSVIIGLIVTGACIAAGAAIWTVIRKWKFGASRHFEDRLEPITWEPTQASGLPHDPTVAALERASSRNGGSQAGGAGRGSFGSDDARNMTSVNNDAISMAPDFPPPHDFTAGAGAYNQGGAGYVDMHRGPSPAPPMGAYGGAHYDTPNPYEGYDYGNQGGYGQRRY